MTDKPKRVTKKEMIHGASSDTSKIIFTKDDIFSGRMFTNKQLMDCLIQHMNQCIDLESRVADLEEVIEDRTRDVVYLTSRVADLESQNEKYKKAIDKDINAAINPPYILIEDGKHLPLDIVSLREKNKDLESKLKIAREALEFYADEENWQDCWIDGCPGSEDYFTSIKDDMGGRVGGWRAREALVALKEIDNGD